MTGNLSVVATPIGNLDDLSPRAREVLGCADRILAEDTRHTRKLLSLCGISAPQLVSLHEHNERGRIDQVLAWLASGEQLALVSDAGTPLISDPGYPLVRAVREAGYRVIPVPGACALIAALSASGLPTDRFVFEGFLPSRASARRETLARLRHEPRTLVFYESGHRIEQMLSDAMEIMGQEREVVVARELTKTFETFLGGTLEEVLDAVRSDDNQRKGEFVVMVRGAKDVPDALSLDENRLLEALAEVLPPKTAAVTAVRLLGGHKRQWYERLMALKKTGE